MACSKGSIGVVVVGLGIAGKVRVRDLLQVLQTKEHKQFEKLGLVGHVSRRDLTIEGSTPMTLEESLKNENVHFIIICTENERHEQIAYDAFDAGKHVLVEFPLALTADRARGVYTKAKERGVICYEEDISLLTDQHQYVKELVKEKPSLVEGRMWLSGRFNGWIENFDKNGSPFHSSVSMIHSLLDIFGNITSIQAKVVKTEKTLHIVGTVKTPDEGLIEITVKRECLDKPTRDTGFFFKFADDTVIDSKNLSVPIHSPKKTGLFLQDLIQFMDIVYGGKDSTEMEKLTIQGLEVADELFNIAKNNPESKL